MGWMEEPNYHLSLAIPTREIAKVSTENRVVAALQFVRV
jgi:hypothetical protein